MSAFICNHSHVTALAVYVARNRILGWTDANEIGEMLHTENVRSVNYRYNETTEADFAMCTWAASHQFSEVQIIKAARCLRYQSCEHPDWDASDACKILEEIIGDDATHNLPGYDEAEWEISPPRSTSPIELTEDEFDDRFPLVANHLNPTASWCVNEQGGCLFETYGEELEFVRNQNPLTVWTLVDGDDGDQYLLSGFHFVNRIGYLISRVPVAEGADMQVHIPMQDADDGETSEPKGR